ncbi:hypothetical protein ACHAXM_004458 [Skeletonema potamos]|jgi:hypothetical protein
MEPDDTQSEYPGRSHASKSSLLDTQSEPPGFSYMKVDHIMKRKDSIDRSVKSTASSMKSAAVGASSSTSVCADSRSVVSSSSNASKLDARVQSSTRSQNAATSRTSKSRASAVSASSKEKNPLLSSSNRSGSVKNKSKISSSSPNNNKLALVQKSKVNDPPTGSVSPSTAPLAHLDPPSYMLPIHEEQQDPLASDESQATEKKGNNRPNTIDSLSGNESDYDEYDEDDQSRDSYTRASELASAVGRALVQRRQSIESGKIHNQLIKYDASADPKNVEGGLVPARERYLASAVDNIGSMVPVDSESYEAYNHTFVTCPEFLRFRFLYTFLKKNRDKKILIFFSTSNSVRFHAELLKRLHIHVLTMHSRQRREKFINTFFKFADMVDGILCTTDAAGRDLDIPPSVDYVMQFEPPDDPSEYILRVARIACDPDRIGHSVLFLNPGEQGFLKYYTSAAITVSEFELPKLADNQLQIEDKVNESERLLQLAKDAYGSYLISYASHGFRDVYNVHDLNKGDVATAFGLVEIPHGDDEEEESMYPGDALNSGKGRKPTWELTKKKKTKTWMKDGKLWPHTQIKLHPKFKQNGET